jgi:hypothetical protein
VIFQRPSSAIFRRVFQYSGNGQPRSAGYIRRLQIAEGRSPSLAKLKAARDRKIAAGEKCGGGKSYAEARPGDVELGRQLRRPDPDRRPISLRCFCRTRLCRVNRQAIRSCGHRVYRTDASHDLARRQMPVTDQPLAAVSVSLSA